MKMVSDKVVFYPLYCFASTLRMLFLKLTGRINSYGCNIGGICKPFVLLTIWF